jgi:hypothetical protein
MKSGQYITITHNDAIILDATLLYGVSMHDGVSKILSLDARDKLSSDVETQTQPQLPENHPLSEMKDTIEELSTHMQEDINTDPPRDV